MFLRLEKGMGRGLVFIGERLHCAAAVFKVPTATGLALPEVRRRTPPDGSTSNEVLDRRQRSVEVISVSDFTVKRQAHAHVSFRH